VKKKGRKKKENEERKNEKEQEWCERKNKVRKG
jgi:hypothetical protein